MVFLVVGPKLRELPGGPEATPFSTQKRTVAAAIDYAQPEATGVTGRSYPEQHFPHPRSQAPIPTAAPLPLLLASSCVRLRGDIAVHSAACLPYGRQLQRRRMRRESLMWRGCVALSLSDQRSVQNKQVVSPEHGHLK
ncbi:hypothetical protein AA0119_g13295 [Alternaria tenuissima]|uniref:Uncharacterized protein n=2 Tax=Alternaria alternata complex TaxID=187734 RepID=A0A4Q4MU59_ALTAL|nr:hypothetical protein AA0117_g13093 [Alternaria alternata]RYN85215.1 hypothetical protein AA0119_g13295 [Alternaria tenuissima]